MKNKDEMLKDLEEENSEEVKKEAVSKEKKSKKKINVLEERIEELEAELKVAKNDYLKAYADVENTRRRLKNEYDQMVKYRIQSFASEILPVLDNFERAMSGIKEEDQVYQGVMMIYNQLLDTLKKEGVTIIEALDKPFDPDYHQAMLVEKVEGIDPGIVIEELQKGYMLKDRVLRATLVKVSE